MTTRRIDEARAIARTVIQRIVQDPVFAGQLRTDPRATLLATGFPEWALDDFVTYDLGIEPDVAGYVAGECQVTVVLGIDRDGILEN